MSATITELEYNAAVQTVLDAISDEALVRYGAKMPAPGKNDKVMGKCFNDTVKRLWVASSKLEQEAKASIHLAAAADGEEDQATLIAEGKRKMHLSKLMLLMFKFEAESDFTHFKDTKGSMAFCQDWLVVEKGASEEGTDLVTLLNGIFGG